MLIIICIDISVSREQSKESIHSETTNQLGSVKFAEGTTFDRERTGRYYFIYYSNK